MQQLQHSIREASGDARLMNPIAFAESHPDCEVNAQGQQVLPNGVAWQQHLLVLMVSAKLLADAEGAMQSHGEAGGKGSKRGGGTGRKGLCKGGLGVGDRGGGSDARHGEGGGGRAASSGVGGAGKKGLLCVSPGGGGAAAAFAGVDGVCEATFRC